MDRMQMLRNTKPNTVDTNRPHVTLANLSQYERAVALIRLGTIDVCNQAPPHPDYDKWSFADQCNYEIGRQHAGNLIAAINSEERDMVRQAIIKEWPEGLKRIPALVEKALGIANDKIGSAYPDKSTIRPHDPNVRAEVSRDLRGRMTFKIPTVSDS
jgi:hypothetical protein